MNFTNNEVFLQALKKFIYILENFGDENGERLTFEYFLMIFEDVLRSRYMSEVYNGYI